MTKHINWSDMADDLVHGNWGQQGEGSNPLIKSVNDDRLEIVLLIDIAKSLRILRCQNFREIPNVLKSIKTNTQKPKRRKASVK